eukprot:TRINITY_DN54770_c0_g1_i1.p2 TRINITY_DN54770_c0_g1~~TRINITY_DN54770_c0_g1_i1.p2  ORF type:complete len:269 (+),score=24.75 TRINITY_DN54770_c0_g1_i1:339-1145(+)
MAIHIVGFARDDVYPYIKDAAADSVTTGLLNGKIGNKGGVGISFLLCNTSFLFVNCHFTAHQDNVQYRNADFQKIAANLTNRTSKQIATNSSPTNSESQKKQKDEKRTVIDRFDVVFWSGDLNYRIDGTHHMITVLLKDEGYRDVLLKNDQLTREKDKGRIFVGFSEGHIDFRPTYKYHKVNGEATDDYDKSEKQRIPAWTDRILWKTNPVLGKGVVDQLRYTAIQDDSLRTSDHRPVVGHFVVQTEKLAGNAQSVESEANTRVCCIM